MSFVMGQRVQSHPATDSWARGDRYGVIVRTNTRGYFLVKMDRSGRTVWFAPSLLTSV